jgi:hypothetical protein
MRSSYTGFGYSSLSNDVEDISALVMYLRGLRKDKIVLLGSSTGKLDAPGELETKLTSRQVVRIF